MQVSADDIRRALRAGELMFYYQPKVSFLTGEVTGAEALIRWRRGVDDVVLPQDFIPLAEAEGLISDITQAMFPRLVTDIQRIRGEMPHAAVAFNVSAHDLESPRLGALVRDAVLSGAVDKELLELEITESAVVSCDAHSNRSLVSLVGEGIHLSMDDYGTGFSSLDTLNRLPFSAIKIDQGFVLKMIRSPKSTTLVKASVATAQMLGIKTVVEGIESETVYHFLMHSGCSEAQGFWISVPLPLEAFIDFLRAGRRWPSSPVGMLRMAQLSHTWQHKLLMDQVFAYLRSSEPHQLSLENLHIHHRHCTLGQWCCGAGQIFAGDHDFDTLQNPHRRMHGICEDIFTALHGKAPNGVLETLLRELNEAACTVSNCLQRLETRLLIGELG